jgi:hypothetical protein
LTGITLPQAAWFAGGVQGDFTFLNTIDVVTVDANGAIQTEHTAHSLSIASAFAAGAYSQGKVIIAGGMTQFNIDSENKNATATFTDRVDIFDVATGKRTTSKLSSSAGGYITAVATKDFVFFAAGLKKAAYTLNVDIIYQDTSNAVDVYHVKSGEWRKLTLAGGARMWATGMAVSTTANAVVISPGSIYEGAERSYTDQLDVLSAASRVRPLPRRPSLFCPSSLRSLPKLALLVCKEYECNKAKTKKGKTKRGKEQKDAQAAATGCRHRLDLHWCGVVHTTDGNAQCDVLSFSLFLPPPPTSTFCSQH